jgi:hypothetical protein
MLFSQKGFNTRREIVAYESASYVHAILFCSTPVVLECNFCILGVRRSHTVNISCMLHAFTVWYIFSIRKYFSCCETTTLLLVYALGGFCGNTSWEHINLFGVRQVAPSWNEGYREEAAISPVRIVSISFFVTSADENAFWSAKIDSREEQICKDG